MSASPPRPAPHVARLAPYSVPSAGRRGMLRFDFNENLLGPSPLVLERLRAVGPEDIALYPDETEALAAVRRRFVPGPDLDAVLTSGVDEGIRLVCDAFLRPDDRVLLLEPGYPLYRFYATLAGASVEEATSGLDLAFPRQAIERAVAGGCRLLVLGDPNNPTGTPAPQGLIEAIAARHPETIVLADQAYAEFAGRAIPNDLAGLPNLIVARTFSKAYGLAGLRAGVLLGHRDTLGWIARMRSPYAVNALALMALCAALEDEAYVARYVEEVRAARGVLRAGLAAMGIPSYPSAANFLLARFGEEAPRLREALLRRGVLVRDRSAHPLLRGTLRLGVGTRAQAALCLEAVRAALAEVRDGRER